MGSFIQGINSVTSFPFRTDDALIDDKVDGALVAFSS